eukprot:tig00001154_g7265.t1
MLSFGAIARYLERSRLPSRPPPSPSAARGAPGPRRGRAPAAGREAAAAGLRLVLLNPARAFREVLAEARAVLLAGGTLQPLADIRQQLLAPVPPDRIRTLSCAHVVPRENVLAMALGRGPGGAELDFTFEKRSSEGVMRDAGLLILNLCALVPDGLVLFLPSYAYQEQLLASWRASGILPRIAARKQVFQEPRGAGEVEATLAAYRAAIEAPPPAPAPPGAAGAAGRAGAVMTCVVGGKLSEGLNFADGLARAVVVLGIPFPSPDDPLVRERVRYFDAAHARDPAACPLTGREWLHGSAMKAVNQSIGRAIRHRADYAAILLADRRYLQGAQRAKLPGWIGEELQAHEGYGTMARAVAAFFAAKRPLQEATERQRAARALGPGPAPRPAPHLDPQE